ncbi:MAG TPA: phosphatase PAP2 family protein [Acidimicrobiales bacterium]
MPGPSDDAGVPTSPGADRRGRDEPHEGRARRAWRERREWRPAVLGAVVAGAVVLLAVLCLLVRHDEVTGWEPELVEAAVEVPDVVGRALWLVMQLGRRLFVPLVALTLLLATRRRDGTVAVVVAGILTGVGTDRWKAWAGRDRPEGVPTREDIDGFGFPSGHTATAFALATVIASLAPARWRPVPFVVAALVGLGRITSGVHYPLDVVGGALWGVATGAATLAVLRALSDRR